MANSINAAAESSTVKHFVTHLPCRLSRKPHPKRQVCFHDSLPGSCIDYVSLLYYKKACVSRANLKFLYIIFGAFVCRADIVQENGKMRCRRRPPFPAAASRADGGRKGLPPLGETLDICVKLCYNLQHEGVCDQRSASFGKCNKPMNVFGADWEGHFEKIKRTGSRRSRRRTSSSSAAIPRGGCISTRGLFDRRIPCPPQGPQGVHPRQPRLLVERHHTGARRRARRQLCLSAE